VPPPPSLSRLLRRSASRRPARPSAPPDGWTVLAAWGPCGFSPVAPGTVGTLGAVPVAWGLSRLETPLALLTLAALAALSVLAADRAARYRARAAASARRPPAGPPRGWTLLAAWGPCGLSPVAPGTVGTLGAVPLAWAVARLEPLPAAAFLAAFLALSVHAAGHAGRQWGVVDASQIVIDEVMGYLVTMAFVPFSWPAAAAGFVLFRLFDVWKPWPVSALDRLKSGLGVTGDDLAAGVYAGLALLALRAALAAWLGCGGGPWWCGGAP